MLASRVVRLREHCPPTSRERALPPTFCEEVTALAMHRAVVTPRRDASQRDNTTCIVAHVHAKVGTVISDVAQGERVLALCSEF
jgi:hypothetical protein